MKRRMSGAAALVLLATHLWAVPTLADPGDVECRESPGYLVVQRVRKDRRSDFLLKKKAHPSDEIPCAFTRQDGDFLIGGQGKEYSFVAQKDDVLVLRHSSRKSRYGPHLKLIVLGERIMETDLGILSGVDRVNEKGVDLWMKIDTRPDKNNCPDYIDGSEGADLDKYINDKDGPIYLIRKSFFDFASRKIVPGTETQCLGPH